jgi:outer membrane protein OmpA-like peptidoglycan-associated protein
MDKQEERFARIPGTTPERIDSKTLLVHFDSDVLYAVDSFAISPAGRDALSRVAEVLLEYPKTAVVIQGHTDSTGSADHNQRLSTQRAESVHNFLVARGIPPARMAAIGMGEDYPVAGNDTPGGRQLNRRVDVLLRAKAT